MVRPGWKPDRSRRPSSGPTSGIVGGPVNAASRLESTAAPDQIQISHDTYALIKDKIYCRPIGEVKVKGIARELRTFEVVGPLDEIEEAAEIRAAAGSFNLQLDPASMDHEEAEMARQALRQALAALEPVDDD